ncbi:hypothetical protein GCM10010319_53210 [Streptomyces blastmyceticus]|uniref:Uncharacterized protein n=1 Tax=Streptomyces blastmyceticus TaxID=68180 RepID=A0ABN0XN90_9ACTN
MQTAEAPECDPPDPPVDPEPPVVVEPPDVEPPEPLVPPLTEAGASSFGVGVGAGAGGVGDALLGSGDGEDRVGSGSGALDGVAGPDTDAVGSVPAGLAESSQATAPKPRASVAARAAPARIARRAMDVLTFGFPPRTAAARNDSAHGPAPGHEPTPGRPGEWGGGKSNECVWGTQSVGGYPRE